MKKVFFFFEERTHICPLIFCTLLYATSAGYR